MSRKRLQEPLKALANLFVARKRCKSQVSARCSSDVETALPSRAVQRLSHCGAELIERDACLERISSPPAQKPESEKSAARQDCADWLWRFSREGHGLKRYGTAAGLHVAAGLCSARTYSGAENPSGITDEIRHREAERKVRRNKRPSSREESIEPGAAGSLQSNDSC